MCGRYYIADEDTPEELIRIIEEVNRRNSGNAVAVKTSGEVFPTDTVPVVANSRSLHPASFAMKWGYTLPDGKPIINARSETAAQKVMFKDGMLQRRCLIPATNYFEWEKRDDRKVKYAIQPTGSKIMYMAGIYRMEQGRPIFSILTRAPVACIEFIHNRMPVVLRPDIIYDWLNTEYNANEILKAALDDMTFVAA
ncbi:MAG: SOS response-associated peptidase [Lentisphaerae bacterium]|nr:SOS response-associated peptidase [Lentisphaerota bacterium]